MANIKYFDVVSTFETIAVIRWNTLYDGACVWAGLKDLTNGEFDGGNLDAFISYDDTNDDNYRGEWHGANFIIIVEKSPAFCVFYVRAMNGSHLRERVRPIPKLNKNYL